MNKEICKRCIEKEHSGRALTYPWDNVDEASWDEGEIFCNAGRRSKPGFWRKKEEVFKMCPYRLEHAVAEGMKDA